MKKWEYLKVPADKVSTQDINMLGATGWELVCSIVIQSQGPFLYFKRDLYFKRELK